jgi:hypothetical protein
VNHEARKLTRSVQYERRAPAIDRLSPEGRAVLVQCLARAVLRKVRADLEEEEQHAGHQGEGVAS